jgi:hypothetical protein
MNRILTIAALLVVANQVQAKEGVQALSGAGAMSCGKYVAWSADRGTADLFETWGQGFLSGLNFAEHGHNGNRWKVLPDADTIKLYLDKYCKDNPLGHPYEGLIQMFVELRYYKEQQP